MGELRPGLPDPGDVFATLQRVIDATRAVVQVDGASLALEHEDGSLRWVVVTDGAAGLLEDAQRDLGEGPGLAVYADAAAVAVVDLDTARRFARLAAAVIQLGLQGVPAVPVAVADRPVGRCRCMQPSRVRDRRAAASQHGAGARDAEVAELTQALTARVWGSRLRGR